MKLIRLLKNDLASECHEWVKENIVTHQQAVEICKKYDIDFTAHHSKASKLGYSLLVGLSFLLLGAALFLIVGRNWEQIPTHTRILLSIFLTFGLSFIGCRISNIFLLFLSSISYGASIFLIVQTYHLGAYWAPGFLIWSLGTMAMGWFAKSNAIMLLGNLIGFWWFCIETQSSRLSYSYLLLLMVSFIFCFKVKNSSLNFILTVISTVIFGGFLLAFNGTIFNAGTEHIIYLAGALLFLYSIASLWENRSWTSQSSGFILDYAANLKTWIVRASTVLLLVFSFRDPWKLVFSEQSLPLPNQVIFYIFLCSFVMTAIFTLVKKVDNSKAIFINLLFFVVSVSVILLDRGNIFPVSVEKLSLIMSLTTNLLILVSAIHYINYGVKTQKFSSVFFGATLIIITAFFRYIVLVGGYFGGTLIFVFGAMVLLFSAKLLKKSVNEY